MFDVKVRQNREADWLFLGLIDSPDWTGHPPIPLQVMEHPFPAAEAGGGGPITHSACWRILSRADGVHSSLVRET